MPMPRPVPRNRLSGRVGVRAKSSSASRPGRAGQPRYPAADRQAQRQRRDDAGQQHPEADRQRGRESLQLVGEIPPLQQHPGLPGARAVGRCRAQEDDMLRAPRPGGSIRVMPAASATSHGRPARAPPEGWRPAPGRRCLRFSAARAVGRRFEPDLEIGHGGVGRSHGGGRRAGRRSCRHRRRVPSENPESWPSENTGSDDADQSGRRARPGGPAERWSCRAGAATRDRPRTGRAGRATPP